MDRQRRGMTQRMFLLKVEETANCWSFLVEGFSGNNYHLKFRENYSPDCTCPDFRTRKTVCKHMFFVVERIANLPKLTETLHVNKMTPDHFRMLSNGIKVRLQKKEKANSCSKEEIDVKVGGN